VWSWWWGYDRGSRPTVDRGLPEKRIGRRRRREFGMLTTEELRVQLERAGVADVAEQKGEEEKVGVGTTTWQPAGGSGRRGVRVRTQQRREAGLGRGDDDAWLRAQQEVDGGGLKSGGQGSGTDGGAEKAGEKQSRAGARGRREGGPGTRLQNLRIIGTLR
jgi:hypothetical protein